MSVVPYEFRRRCSVSNLDCGVGGLSVPHITNLLSVRRVMPYKYRQLDNHADAVHPTGTVTAPGLYGKSSTPVKKDKNYKVRPNSDKVGK